MAERDPLFPRPQENAGNNEKRQTDSVRRCLAVVLAVAMILAILATLAALSGTAVYVIRAHSYKNNTCENLTLSVSAHTRSGSYSSLVQIPRETVLCYKPPLSVTLKSYSSTVDVYQTLCKDINTNPFQIRYELTDITMDGGPIAVFNENFSPQNYFYGEGQISVGIVNLTTNQTSVNVVTCLFTNVDEYGDFRRAEKNWKNFTNTAKCTSIIVESGKNYESTINITGKSFIFVGMAATDPVHISTLKISAAGQDIDNPGENSTKVCQLNGDKRECTFNLQASTDGKDVCILAYQDDNPDGSYDYSNVTLSLSKREKPHNPYDRRVKSFGFSLAGLIPLCLGLIIATTCTCVYRKGHQKTSIQDTNQPEEEGDTQGPRGHTINYQKTFNY